jgi:hypothetical protein
MLAGIFSGEFSSPRATECISLSSSAFYPEERERDCRQATARAEEEERQDYKHNMKQTRSRELAVVLGRRSVTS